MMTSWLGWGYPDFAKSQYNRLRRGMLRARLRSRDFTIVSNNCWGAHVYQQLGIPYQTPFVGLFLTPECYVTLVPRLRWYLSQQVRFVKKSKYERINEFREKQGRLYPIGRIGDDVELQFLHYQSESDATEKWTRRAARVTHDDSRLFFKFCDRDGCTRQQLESFDTSPVAHKVIFISTPSPSLTNAVWIPSGGATQVPDGLQLSRISPAYFDVVGWINGTDGTPPWWWPLRQPRN